MVWLTQEEISNLILLSVWGGKPENLPNFLMEEILPCTGVTPYFHILIVIISTTNPLQLKVLVFHFLTFHICHVIGLLLSLLFLSWSHHASRPSSFLVLLHIYQLQMAWKEPEGCVFSLVTRHALGSEPGLYTAGKKPSCFCSLSSLSRLQPSLFCRPLDKPICTEPESDFPRPNFLLDWIIA